MCSLYQFSATPEDFQEAFAILRDVDYQPGDLQPSYLIKPTHRVLVIRHDERRLPIIGRLTWGLIPSWAKDRKGSLINARCETVATKPSFRSAFKSRRCIIPANGFYEYESTSSRTKQRWHIHRSDRGLLTFAGIWESWLDEEEQPLETCAIVTTAANALLSPLNDRIPVILPPEAFAEWLDVDLRDTDALQKWFHACPDDYLTREPVASTQEDSAKCIRPVPQQRGLFD